MFAKISENFEKFRKISKNFEKFQKISKNFEKFRKISNFEIQTIVKSIIFNRCML